MPHTKADVAIVGAGILGLAHAYLAAKTGKSVIVLEKNPGPLGASIRNFGMIWPIGQPADRLRLALRSRELWLEILDLAKLPSRQTGSLHLTYREDEAAVAQEFVELGPGLGYQCSWLSPQQVQARSQAVQPSGLRGALWSSTELTVDPRQVMQSLPRFLAERYNVNFFFGAAVTAIEPPILYSGNGQWHAKTVIVCNGDDFETLYPKQFASSRLTRCKLQMMRTAPQPAGWQLGPSLAAGLTLRFYPAFQICTALPALTQRISRETPEYDRWGIHALVSQTADGCLTLGDSHEYGLAVDIFDKEEIDAAILRYTHQFLRAPGLAIAERWHGVYAKHPEKPFLVMHPDDEVRVVTAFGGSGMTLSFAVAEQSMQALGFTHA